MSLYDPALLLEGLLCNWLPLVLSFLSVFLAPLGAACRRVGIDRWSSYLNSILPWLSIAIWAWLTNSFMWRLSEHGHSFLTFGSVLAFSQVMLGYLSALALLVLLILIRDCLQAVLPHRLLHEQHRHPREKNRRLWSMVLALVVIQVLINCWLLDLVAWRFAFGEMAPEFLLGPGPL